jgi:hypothetical protein
MLTVKFTDASLAAILKHVEAQLARGDIVTLTRLQILTLLEAAGV